MSERGMSKKFLINEQLREIIGECLSKEERHGIDFPAADEVYEDTRSEYQQDTSTDNFQLLEEPQSYQSIGKGVRIPELSLSEYYGEKNYGAIDGSSGKRIWTDLAFIVVRSALGTNSKNEELDVVRLMNEKVGLIPFLHTHLTLKAKRHPRIFKCDKSKNMLDNVSIILRRELGKIEIETLHNVAQEYEGELNYLGIDGPLYSSDKDLGKKSYAAVKLAMRNVDVVFSIVKRCESKIFVGNLARARQKQEKTSTLVNQLDYYNDAVFFSRLREGRRSPFFEHITKRETEAGVTKNGDSARVCTYVKFSNGKIVRIEIPRKIAYEGDTLERANEIVNVIYWQAKKSSKSLPNYFHLADRACNLSKVAVKNMSKPIEQFILETGGSITEFSEWKT